MWFTFTLFDLNLFFPFEMLRYLSYLKWRGGISNFDNAKPKLQTLSRHTYSLSHFILCRHKKINIFRQTHFKFGTKIPEISFENKTNNWFSIWLLQKTNCDPLNIERHWDFVFHSIQLLVCFYTDFLFFDSFLINANYGPMLVCSKWSYYLFIH